MKRPPIDVLLVAALWCKNYAGDNEKTRGDLREAAEWLLVLIERARRDEFVRCAVRETGCSRAMAVRGWRRANARAEGELPVRPKLRGEGE